MFIVITVKTMIRLAGIVTLFWGVVLGQSPDVVTLTPKIEANQLITKCRFKNLITAEMKEGLSSGMSRSFVFSFKLLQDNKKELAQKEQTVYLKYNVWEDFYIVKFAAKTHTFKTSDAFNTFLNDSLIFSISAVSALPKDKSLRILMVYASDDIATSQKEKLDNWLKQSESTDKSISDQENRSGFSINLSGLLTLFFGKDENKNQKVYPSDVFTIQSLK